MKLPSLLICALLCSCASTPIRSVTGVKLYADQGDSDTAKFDYKSKIEEIHYFATHVNHSRQVPWILREISGMLGMTWNGLIGLFVPGARYIAPVIGGATQFRPQTVSATPKPTATPKP